MAAAAATNASASTSQTDHEKDAALANAGAMVQPTVKPIKPTPKQAAGGDVAMVPKPLAGKRGHADAAKPPTIEAWRKSRVLNDGLVVNQETLTGKQAMDMLEVDSNH